VAWKKRKSSLLPHSPRPVCGFVFWAAASSVTLHCEASWLLVGVCLQPTSYAKMLILPVSLVTLVYFYLTDTWKVIATLTLHCSDKCAPGIQCLCYISILSESISPLNFSFSQRHKLTWFIALPQMPPNNRLLGINILTFLHWNWDWIFRNVLPPETGWQLLWYVLWRSTYDNVLIHVLLVFYSDAALASGSVFFGFFYYLVLLSSTVETQLLTFMAGRLHAAILWIQPAL